MCEYVLYLPEDTQLTTNRGLQLCHVQQALL